ncbi:TAP-like protein-domain-containing protein [Bombardia bombarda]|uniref:TAP-like protein-domain-containing protein n=1 Tax=Bombardia bombarda TaxID=252184 RepID=A0AA39XAT6_9PEZI|nr:TAP-like protein-domain-containing protein [Bombardia bombarda]
MGSKSRSSSPLGLVAYREQGPSVRRLRSSVSLAAILVAAVLLLLLSLRSDGFGGVGLLPASWWQQSWQWNSSGDDNRNGNGFKWTDITPSRSLKWTSCYEGSYDCARLDVPMDWQDPSPDEGKRVVLAIIRLRAKTKTGLGKNASDSNYRGPVFFNPGGPGGSGIWSLRDHGHQLQTIVGDNHDIISFDPRGIGASVPRIECWGSAQDRLFWDLQDVGVADAHPGVLHDAFARAAAFSRVCEQNMEASGILRHSSTTYHARDMLEILHQMGEEKLKYWGNVDYKEWYYGSYINFLHDTDMVMDAFYEFCHQAGPLRCLFHAATPQAVKERLDALLARIRITPVLIAPAADGDGGGPAMPELVTYSKVKRMISTALYQPIFRFRRVAAVLAGLERGDGGPYYDYTSRGVGPDPATFCSAETVPPTIPTALAEGTDDAFPAIMCTDAQPLNETVGEFEKYADRLTSISEAAGAVQIAFRLSCVGRSVRPKWRFDGPFEANTSFPILFVANVADNVTPLVSATNNSAGFPGSVVLVQNSYGHTSLSAASTCTALHIRAYFQDGTLPAAGTVCEPDTTPFEAAFLLDDAGGCAVGGDDDDNDYNDDDSSMDGDADTLGELTDAVHRLSREANWALRFRPSS